MFRSALLIALAAFGAVAYAQDNAPAKAQDKSAAATTAAPKGNVAVVNGKAIKQSDLDTVIKQIKQPDTPELRGMIKDKLIEIEVLTQEAKRRKLGEREDIKFTIENAQRNILIQALLRDELDAHKPTDAAIQAEYDRERQAVGDKEYKVHHILVKTEQEAKDIIAKLDKGEKFEDLAKASQDPGSANKGGELDWASPGGYVKPFSDAMVALEKGKYTATPVQSQFGWHVIRLDDVRASQPPALDQVKSHIVEALQQEQAKEFVADLKKKAVIK